MYILYLDELGHNGPYHSKTHNVYNHHPVSGMGGIYLPSENVRGFTHWFFNLKKGVFKKELSFVSKPQAQWEKKGTDYFKPTNVLKNRQCRRVFISVLNKIQELGGGILYACEQKARVSKPRKGVSENIYRRNVEQSIRIMDKFCNAEAKAISKQKNKSVKPKDFITLLDNRSCPTMPDDFIGKLMYKEKLYTLVEPPLMAQSHMYQTLQVADWICAVVGHLMHYGFEQTDKKIRQCYVDSFAKKLEELSSRYDTKTYHIKKWV